MTELAGAQEGAHAVRQLMGRATAAHQRGGLGEAEALYLQALQIRPDLLEARHLLGVLRGQQGRYEEALELIATVLRAKPDKVEALTHYGLILHELKRYVEALANLDKALEIVPDYPLALLNRGNVLAALGRDEDALASYNRAVTIRPHYAEAYNNIGTTLRDVGRLAEAKTALLRALELNPKLARTYLNLANYQTFTADDPHLVALQALEHEDSLSATDRMHLHFAIGKAYSDVKDYGRAFEHLLRANAQKRSQITYDEAAATALFERIETKFTRDLLAAKAGRGDPSPLPIFILGMPRSGSTLIEQILASHRDVHGAGELNILPNIVNHVYGLDRRRIPYPDFVASVDDGVFAAIGAIYLAELQKLNAHAKRVTDKMPQNFLLAGLIHLALPNARIIHAVRDPVDTCVSCFATLFADGQNHSYDLAELGRYYHRYQALMKHWHRVLPKGRILDVSYEDVIDDLEEETRRILAHCGLDWDPRCLEFHRTERPVRTASANQVRQPIYQSAIGRWRAYEPYLGPLLAELKPAAASTEGVSPD
jgi:tetratricopeptide (TPR) repeat protein